MAEHTPGPWSCERGSSDTGPDGFYVVSDAPEYRNLSIWDDSGICRRDEDARLIASAPETAAERDKLREINADLLSALEAIEQEAGECYCADNVAVPGPCGYCIARTAIAKARGQ